MRMQVNQFTLPPEAILIRRMHGIVAVVLRQLRAGADWGAHRRGVPARGPAGHATRAGGGRLLLALRSNGTGQRWSTQTRRVTRAATDRGRSSRSRGGRPSCQREARGAVWASARSCCPKPAQSRPIDPYPHGGRQPKSPVIRREVGARGGSAVSLCPQEVTGSIPVGSIAALGLAITPNRPHGAVWSPSGGSGGTV